MSHQCSSGSRQKIRRGAARRLGHSLVLIGLLFPAMAQQEGTLPSSYKRVIRKMGDSVRRGLGLERDRIRKSRHPYSERSFSNPENAAQRSEQLRQLHAQAFHGSQGLEATHEVSSLVTNVAADVTAGPPLNTSVLDSGP